MNTFQALLRMQVKIQTRASVVAFLIAACSLAQAASLPATRMLPELATGLPSPQHVFADQGGRIYVSDSRAGKVAVLDAFGRLLSTKDQLSAPLGIAADSLGRIYVGEEGLGRVTVFDAGWNVIGALGAGTNEFALPNHITVREAGSEITVLVSDSSTHTIKAYRDNARVQVLGSYGAGAGQFNFPAGMALNQAGELLVIDQNNDRVQVFNSALQFARSFSLKRPNTSGHSGVPQGLAVDASDRIYVADSFQGYLRAFGPDGTSLGQLGAYGRASGQFRTPMSVAASPDGRLYVTSVNNSRVDVIGLDCFTQLAANPGSQIVGAGQVVSFTVSADCAGNPVTSYQWYKGTNSLADGGIISGSTSNTLVLAGVTASDAGDYSVTVVLNSGAVTSPPAQLSVVAAPVITRSPSSLSLKEGAPASFSVQASGGQLGYQWFYNGNALAGDTDPSLVLTSAQISDAGSYTVWVTNVAGTATSSIAVLSVQQYPFFNVQPVAPTVAEYGAFTLSGAAGGSAPISYSWYRNGSFLSGSTGTSLTYSNVSPALNGDYTLVAVNSAGSATSAVARVTVQPDIVRPAVLSVSGGSASSLTLVVTFSEPVRSTTATLLSNYSLAGSGGLTINSAVLSNGTNVTLNLSGKRVPGMNYTLTIQNVTDVAYSPNTMQPNPVTLPVRMNIDLLTINGTSWKYYEATNNLMDGQAWKTAAYNDSSWSSGFGIFYGNRTNSVTQPLPNPNVKLPFSLSSSDPNNTKVNTILNVFTNAGNAIRTITYYFRTTFDFPAETNGTSLLLHGIIDDGAVTYINGVEARRDRLAAGTVSYSTLASSSGSQSWSPAITAAGNSIPITGLKRGTNVIAVELHQRTSTDDDVTLGFWLEGVIPAYAVQPRPQLVMTPSVARAGDLVISWDQINCVLESAPTPLGPWTNSGAATPTTITREDIQTGTKFFRLRQTP